MLEIVLNKFELLNLKSNNLMSNDKIKNKVNLKKNIKEKKLSQPGLTWLIRYT